MGKRSFFGNKCNKLKAYDLCIKTSISQKQAERKSVSLLLGNDNLVFDENLRLLGLHLDKNLD